MKLYLLTASYIEDGFELVFANNKTDAIKILEEKVGKWIDEYCDEDWKTNI